MTITEYQSIDQIVAEAAGMVGDGSFRFKSIGWYRSRAKQCIQMIAIGPNRIKSRKTLKISECSDTQIPSGVFGIEQIFVHNNECCDHTSVSIDIKQNANVLGENYNAEIMETGTGMTGDRSDRTGSGHMWVTIGANKLQFNHLAKQTYKYCTIVVKGAWVEINGEPMIPVHVANAARAYTEAMYFKAQAAKDPIKWRAMYATTYSEYEEALRIAKRTNAKMDKATEEKVLQYMKGFLTK